MVESVGSDLAETEKPELAEHEDRPNGAKSWRAPARCFWLKASMRPAWARSRQGWGLEGTLYVYFDSKERLFEAIAHEECGAQAETVFSLDPADHDVEPVLTRLGRSFVKFLCRPGAMSPLRTVIAISDRMPEIGREFYDTGPAEGVTKLCHYLESQVAAGILTIEDCEVAAAQFLDLRGHDFKAAPLQCQRGA